MILKEQTLRHYIVNSPLRHIVHQWLPFIGKFHQVTVGVLAFHHLSYVCQKILTFRKSFLSEIVTVVHINCVEFTLIHLESIFGRIDMKVSFLHLLVNVFHHTACL